VPEAKRGPNLFGFIGILKGLPVVPQIITCVGLVLFFIGVFSGPFGLVHNPKLSAGVALIFSALSWRNFERVVCDDPYKMFLDFRSLFWALAFGVVGAWMFRLCWLTPK